MTNLGNVLAELPTPANVIVGVGLWPSRANPIDDQWVPPEDPDGDKPAEDRRDPQARGMNVSGRALAISPAKNLSRRHYIATFNSLATAAGHGEAKLPESLVQHL